MPNLAGKKISGRHTSFIDVAKDIVVTANNLDSVSKIVLGLIKPIRGRPVDKSLKITVVPAGLKLKVRGPKSVQEIFIYTSERELVSRAITEGFYR